MVLLLLLPFEPRAEWRLGPLGVTVVEAAAGLAGLVLLYAGRERLAGLARRPPWPLAAIVTLALAHLLSALLAPGGNAPAAKFALRMVAMAGFAWLVAAQPAPARRAGLYALVAAAAVVAFLAVGEGAGARWLDPFLDRFREMPFNVAGARRASAGSEYPNQAAAFMMSGLLVAAGLAAGRSRGLLLAAFAGLVFTAGMLQTYSRGALVATGLGLLVQALVAARRRPSLWLAPAGAFVVLILGSAAFAYGGEIFRLRLESEGTARWYGALYEPADPALRLRPAEIRMVRIRVTNTGRKTWNAGESFNLSYHWFDHERRTLHDGGRTRLPRDLASGESVTLDAEVAAPREEGDYLLVWDMVHEHTTWFSGQGVRVAAVAVTVSTSPSNELPPAVEAASIEPDLAWRPTRGELWRLAVSMWVERPLAGFGSDRFRWLYGPRAGRRFWDVKVFANNTLLETAATTGTVGAAALLLTLLTSLAAAARAGGSGAFSTLAISLALLGLIAGLAAHGVVDYVLAFTGHYLLFGFVVGSCAALEAEKAGA